MRRLRLLAGALLLLLAAAFLGSVACPPRKERASDPPGDRARQVLGDGGPREAAAPPAPPAPVREAAPADTAPAADALEVEVLDARNGRPLSGATVRLRYRDADGREQQMERPAGPEGRLRWESLAFWTYAVSAAHPACLPGRAVEVSLAPGGPAPEPLRLALEPGARVEGRVSGPGSAAHRRSVLRLRPAAGGEARLLMTDLEGRFASPVLKAGAWILEWLPEPGADPDPLLRQNLELEAGTVQVLELRTGPEGGGPAVLVLEVRSLL